MVGLVAGEAATRTAHAWAPRDALLAQSSVAPPASPGPAGSPLSVAPPAPGLAPAAGQRLAERPPQHPGPAQRPAPGFSQAPAARPAASSAAPKVAPPRSRPNKVASAGSDFQNQVLAGLKAFGGPDLQGVQLGFGGIIFILLLWVINQAQNLEVVWRALKSLLQRLGRWLLALGQQWRCLLRQRRGAPRPRRPGAKPSVATPPISSPSAPCCFTRSRAIPKPTPRSSR